MYEDQIVHGHAVKLELICCAEGSDHRHSGSFYETVVGKRVRIRRPVRWWTCVKPLAGARQQPYPKRAHV